VRSAVGAGETERLLRLLPIAVVALVASVDVLAGPTIFVPLLAVGPAFASLSGGARRAVAIGCLAIVLCLGLAIFNGILGTWRNNLTFVSILGVTAASAVAGHLRERRERELADVRTVAEVAQRVLLPPVPRRVGALHVAASYISASAHARIGGDLYEVVNTPAGVRLLVGDVRGKGLDAVETAAVMLGAFREAAYDEPGLPEVTVRLEKALNRRLTDEEFVTAVLAEVRTDGHVTLVNCGHPAPLVVGPRGPVSPAEPPDVAPPLGMTSLVEIPRAAYDVAFTTGDLMLFYTDGIIEARDPAGRFYPLVERAELLRGRPPEAGLELLERELLAHVSAPVSDDAAMLLIRHRGQGDMASGTRAPGGTAQSARGGAADVETRPSPGR
jgi:serine phosphatase RsbU (regulator of sigma subunit)